ncbi:TIR domain-containing protein [uncultured Roseobacter sp.]|uniref:TIR domain-containing protein n=1 Tax=uncultured Roseobacter sp. TaxID=114847 RepID=UPI00260F5CD7|nr:TIR domain-containing protein [uncultured Roseobacter sp.]
MLSYARDDSEALDRVIQALRHVGVDIWWDEAITPLAPWDEAIERAIAESDAVLVLWTPRSAASEWVRLEASEAKAQKKLIPLMIEPCSVPIAFRLVQSADLTGWDGNSDDPNWRKVLDWIAVTLDFDPRFNDLGPASRFETSTLFAPEIRDRFAEINQIVERLTEDQFGVLKTLGTTRRVRISGCAGSGKTLVACEKALRCASAGMRVLFLCHSPHLADYVSDMIGGSGVQVADFSTWVSGMLESAGSATAEHWINVEEPDSDTVEKAFDAVLETQNFHCVIVDEGQDFRDTWWLLVEAALHDQADSQLYIFHDDNQALLPFRAIYPFDDPVLNLSRNCRNSGRVFEAVRRFHSQAPAPEAALESHGFLAYFRAEPKDTSRAVDRCLRVLSECGELHDDRVLLLAGGLEKTSLVRQTLVVTGEIDEHWRVTVQKLFTKAVTMHVRKGIVTSQSDALERIAALSDLGWEPRPSPADVQLVCRVARSIDIDEQLVRRLSGGNDGMLDLSWRKANGRLRFRRALGVRFHGIEILRFFSQPSWQDDLPAVIQWQFVDAPAEMSDADVVAVYDIAAFKGLEAETAVILVGHHQPVSTEKLYVGLSRARLALAIVDCSDCLTSFDVLRKVSFDHRNIVGS